MKTSTTSSKSTFSPRIRFNWGYHAGALAVNRNFANPLLPNKAYDKAYYYGYMAGRQDAKDGIYTENSTGAWYEHIGSTEYLPWYKQSKKN